MTENNILEVINRLYPSFEFSYSGNVDSPEYSNITAIKGTLTEDEYNLCKVEFEANEYARTRAYGSISSQLDLLYHDMENDKGDKTGEWYKAIKKVKTDTPK
mgnify:CR=1 FL=1|jgi:hypothetical protein